MRLRAWFLSILAICFLGLTSRAQGQSANFGGLGSAGGLSPGSYQSLGTVPAFAGQSSVDSSGRLSRSGGRGRHGRRDRSQFYSQVNSFDNGVGYSYFYPLALGSADYYAYDWYGYPSEDAGAPYGYPGEAQQSDNGNAGSNASSSPQNGNQQQNQNQGQNQNQNPNAKEQEQPQGPRYLTYTKEANPGLKAENSSKTEPVDLKSAPAGADVSVDGYFLGRTPTSVQIPLGKHLLTIDKWGYREWIQVLDVTANKPLTIDVKLREDW